MPDRETRADERGVKLLVALSEGVLLVLLALAAVRVLQLDSSYWTVVLVTFLPWILAPVWLLLGIGIGARRKRLIAGALVLACAHVAWVAPEFGQRNTAQAQPGDTTLRVATANVLASNQQIDQGFDVIAGLDADVLALQEMPRRFVDQLRAHPLGQMQLVVPYGAPASGTLLLTTRPVLASGTIMGTRTMPWAELDVDGASVTVVSVHTVPALSTQDWKRDLAAIAEWVDTVEGPVVLMGDFNATHQHRQFREILDHDLDDAHRVAGGGWGPTWPTNLPLAGPVLRIDHILVGGGVEVLAFDHGPETGSDHLPILADLILSG